MTKNYYPSFRNLIRSVATGGTIACLLVGGVALAQPTITHLTAYRGTPGITVDTIYGANFNATTNKNLVRFGATRANIISGTTTQLIVTVPLGALNAPISVTDTSITVRKTAYSDTPFVPEYDYSCFIPGQINFKPGVAYTVTSSGATKPYIAALGDLDGDGKTDMLTANYSATTASGIAKVSWFQNTSSGPGNVSQTLVGSVTHSGQPINMKLADIDGDGRLDGVASISGTANVGLYRNITSGAINFTGVSPFRLTYAAGSPYMRNVVVADFDGDGKIDVAAAATGSDSLGVLHNVLATGLPVGAGSFPLATTFTHSAFFIGTASGPASLFVADIDGDGKPDIVTANAINGKISVLRNTSTSGTISFATHVDFAYTASAGSVNAVDVACADLDGDGKQDVFVSANNAGLDGELTILRNTTSGSTISFASGVTYATGTTDYASGLASADIDADGKIDIMISRSNAVYALLYKNRSTSGSISFTNTNSFYIPGSPVGISPGDADNDGKTDVFIADQYSNAISIFRNYPLPYVTAITGPTTICMGSTTDTLRDSVSGGKWISSNSSVVIIDSVNGSVVGVSSGSATITYLKVCQGDSNMVTRAITVATTPTLFPLIAGTTTICSGTTDSIVITNTNTGGTWSNRHPTITTVSTSGVVYGLSGGRDTIYYTKTNACGSASRSVPVLINQSPGPITGITHQCIGNTTTLSNAVSGGTFTSSAPSVSSVISSTASSCVVRGNTVGVDTIIYTLAGGCRSWVLDTVATTPTVSAVSVTSASVCTGSYDTASSATTGGTWTSSDTSIATISSGGIIRGVRAGTVTISYTVVTSCATGRATRTITVVSTPGAITGATVLCAGTSDTLRSSPSGGSWSSSATGTAAIAGATGVVTGGSTAGTATITYAFGACFSTRGITVNPAPPGISGSVSVCLGSTTRLTDSMAGTWGTSNAAIASIDPSSGLVYGVAVGTVTISFTSTAYGCTITRSFRVNALPAAIGGPGVVCAGSTITLTESTTPGTWSSSSASVAAVVGGATTAAVTGGTSVTSRSFATITFIATATGCTASVTIQVDPVPAAIVGAPTVCVGSRDSLYSTTSGGTWTSSSSSIGAVSSTGVVTGVTGSGTPITITYRLSTGCAATYSVTVNPLPSAIAGLSAVCPAYTIALSSAPSTGTWSSIDTNIAAISATGVVTGRAAGPDTVYYTLPTGCRVKKLITVNPAPSAILGAVYVCMGDSTLLADTTTGGIWTSSVAGIARADSFTGKVKGISAGTVTITYTTGTYGCSAFLPFTVYANMTPTVGLTMSTPTTICAGTYVTYTANVTNGGSTPTYRWTVNGVATGIGATLTYAPVNGDLVLVTVTSSLPCVTVRTASSSVRMTVNPLLVPSVRVSTGIGDTVCVGSPITFSPNPVNGGASPSFTWKVNGVTTWLGTTYTYYPANGDVITVTMRTSVTCRTTDTVSNSLRITVSAYLNPGVTLSGSDTACNGYPITLTALPVNGGLAPTYNWYVNDLTTPVVTAGAARYSYMATTRDVVQVQLNSSFPCLTATTARSLTDTITVVPVDTPIVWIINGGYIIAAGGTVWMQAGYTQGGAAPTFQWFRSGILISGATTAFYHTSAFASGDSFVCKVTNHDFCSGITAFGYLKVYIGDNVGVKDVSSGVGDLNVVPNPNSGTFSLRGEVPAMDNEEADVEVTNMLGQIVYTGKLRAVSGAIDAPISLDGLKASGVYMINVHGEHFSKVMRFSVQR